MKSVLLILALFLSACSVVGPGEKGIRVSFGAASDTVIESGYYLWIPFVTGVKSLDCRVQKSTVETSAASKDMQELSTAVAVNWSINATEVVKVYKEVGDEEAIFNNIIAPAVSEVLKATTAKKTALDILTTRTELKNEIDETLKKRLSHYGLNILDISIVNLTFSSAFTHAIEQKQIAEQQAKQAEYLAQKATQDAKAMVNIAKGEAETQQLLRSSITKELLQKQAIEKWNGAFPQVMGSQTLPFINVGPGSEK